MKSLSRQGARSLALGTTYCESTSFAYGMVLDIYSPDGSCIQRLHIAYERAE